MSTLAVQLPAAQALAASASPTLGISLTLLLILTGVVMCLWVGHRWSTLIVGILIGLLLTGPVADTVKNTVTQVSASLARSVSDAVR